VVETTCPLARANATDGDGGGGGGSELGTDILPPPPLIEIHEDPEALFAPPSADGRMDASATPDWLERELQDAEDIRCFSDVFFGYSFIDLLTNPFKRRPSTAGGNHKKQERRKDRKSKKSSPKKNSPKKKESRPREASGNRTSSKSPNQEYQRRLEAQYRQRQNEIRLEAENAVRERERALNDEVVRYGGIHIFWQNAFSHILTCEH
jgi:hypothetical protein